MSYVKHFKHILKEEFKYTNGVIRKRKPKKDIQYNNQK
jgi:hypothetical protein